MPEDRLTSLRSDAREAQRQHNSVAAIELGQQRAGQAQKLSAEIAAGRAGHVEIRRAEDVGTVSASQAEALRAEAERAEIAREAEQVATDELALTFSSGMGFDVGNPQNRRAADVFYVQTYSQALRAGAPKEVLEQVVSMVAKTGYLPPRLARDSTGLLLGGDKAGQVRGAELYGRLHEVAPDLVEEAIDLEARAWGGVLNRWLDAGLGSADALARAEADLAGEAAFSPVSRENSEAFRQDLRKRLGERLGGFVAAELLPRLENKYLTLLGQGISPQKARTVIQRDQARAFMRWAHSESRVLDAGFVWGERDGERVLIPTEPRLQKMAAPVALGAGAAMGSVILVAAAYSYMIQTARDWGFEVPEVMEDLEVWLNSLSEETRIYVIETVPDIASLSNQAVVRLGDGAPHLGRIVKENELGDKRSVEFFLPGHGRVTLDQHYDVTTGRYDGDEITFYDREQKQWVTEKYATSRFNQPAGSFGIPRTSRGETVAPAIIAFADPFAEGGQARVVPSDEQRPILQPGPPAEPVPVDLLPPSEAGTGLELIPDHTGGNQTELGPRIERLPGYPAQEQEPLILVNPNQSDELTRASILHSEASEDDDVKKKVSRSGGDARSRPGASETETTASQTSQHLTESSGSPAETSGSSIVTTATETEQANDDASGTKLTRSGKRELGALASLKDTTALEAVKIRGGGAKEIRAIRTDYQEKTLAELANMAALNDEDADRAIKIVKSAKRLAQKNHRQ